MEEVGTTHEDRLRALGWYLDRRKARALHLTYGEDSFTLALQEPHGEQLIPSEAHFRADEVAAFCQEARRRRGAGIQRATHPSRLTALLEGQATPAPLSQWVNQTHTLSYQDALRAVGVDLDRWNAQWYRIDEQEQGLVIRYRAAGSGPDITQVYPVSREEVRTRIASSIRRRGSRTGPLSASGSTG